MTDPIWVEESVALAIHDEQLSEHGGAPGIRDPVLLASALARPRNLLAHGSPDIAALGAAYAFGIVGNHPFVDGNKRTGLVIAELFLDLNGHELIVSDEECVLTFLQVADGTLDEADLATWMRRNLRER